LNLVGHLATLKNSTLDYHGQGNLSDILEGYKIRNYATNWELAAMIARTAQSRRLQAARGIWIHFSAKDRPIEGMKE